MLSEDTVLFGIEGGSVSGIRDTPRPRLLREVLEPSERGSSLFHAVTMHLSGRLLRRSTKFLI